jgi:uncharacterized protein (DUF433 family)
MQATITINQPLPIQRDPQIMSGVPVFVGTRVPVQTLFDYLLDGYSVTEFLDQFPTVTRDQVSQILTFVQGCIYAGVAAH